MKYRLGFVTNSSSSMFIAHTDINVKSKDCGPSLWRMKELEPILFPEHYADAWVAYMNKNDPRTKKDNPKGISMFLTAEEQKALGTTSIYNPEWEKLPEVPDPWTVEDLYLESKYDWSIKPIYEESDILSSFGDRHLIGLEFNTSMDNFDYISYLKWLSEVGSVKYEITDEEDGHWCRGFEPKTSGLSAEPHERDLMGDVNKEDSLRYISIELAKKLEVPAEKANTIYDYLEAELYFWQK